MGKSTFLQDFKAFAMKGNVIDMAVGVVIGMIFFSKVSVRCFYFFIGSCFRHTENLIRIIHY